LIYRIKEVNTFCTHHWKRLYTRTESVCVGIKKLNKEITKWE
jgi:hypothetical protein